MKKLTIIILVIILIVIILGSWWYIYSNRKVGPGYVLPQVTKQQTMNIQGMQVEVLKQGSGVEAKSGDTVTVNYTGTLTDGTKFDSSLNPGRTPFQFTLGQNNVIQGWELGVVGMKLGEERKLTIPPELAYGSQGAGGVIPPNATLIFEIDLLGIN